MVEKATIDEWTTETGLINDVDVWMQNCRFGFKEEYGSVAGVDSPMFIAEFVNEEGEVVASQGYSVGTGWIVSDDGLSISHPTRKNVVGSSVYGQLINRVVKDLKVNMAQYGKPTEAKSWNGLGFHVVQEEHKTVSGDVRTAPMPTEFLGEKVYESAKEPAGPVSDIEKKLIALASMPIEGFQRQALKLPEVTQDDDLMALVLDSSPEGFWAKHHS